MGRYDARLARLERWARGQPVMREGYFTFTFTETLEAAIQAAESETGLLILEIHPFALPKKAGTNLANALADSDLEILWQR